MALYLVRHGTTEWSLNGRHTSHTDLPLLPEGEEAAKVLASRLQDQKYAAVLTSPRQRALRTAELAGFPDAVVTDDLVEWDYGDYEGITTPQIRERVPGWTVWSHPMPNGETHAEVQERARKVLSEARKILPGGDVVLVGHGHFSRVLIAAWLGLAPDQGVHFGLDPAGICQLGDERGDPQVRRLNVPAWEV
jgi:broad specificity phosphatase PhoE